MTNSTESTSIAVLGLGAMGTAIARTLASSGRHVSVWNRTPRTRAELDAEQLTTLHIRETAAAAVEDADLVVVCVLDHAAARALLDETAASLDGQVVVNVSTGTPAETGETAAHAEKLDVRYVTGAVMVPTPMVGTDDCLVLYAGREEDLADLGPLTEGLGGTSDLTGPDHAVPPALDLAMLDIYFVGMYAHLHATALADRHGIDPGRFLPYAIGIVETLGGTLPDLTAAVERRRYDTGQARLDMCRAFLEHIVATSREVGVDPGAAELVRAASARAMDERPGSTDWDVVAEHFLP